MIRQLGNPWFCSLSAAETRWVHLLKTLGRLVDKKDVLKSNEMPIGEIVDFFYRVEFQQRGSPHIHALFWVKDAPKYEQATDDSIVQFVDKYITCKNDLQSDEMKELINLQTHRHAKTCKKGKQKICRFNFPLPPMPESMILNPLEKHCFDEVKLNEIKKHSDKIKTLLDEMKYGEDFTFKAFLEKLKLTQSEYIQAIRYLLKRPTLLLKRSPSEIRIKNYNTNLLKAWRANMDLQFVLDPYACAVYILSYITKGQRGMSKLLETASKEANAGNKDIVHRIRHIVNKFLNAVEISAQEAVYLVLQMPLRRSSREFQFINTSNPQERTFLLKTLDKIKELPDTSTDIETDNIIKRYQRRPRNLEHLCLANFVAWFSCVKDKDTNDSSINCNSSTALIFNDCLPETDLNA